MQIPMAIRLAPIVLLLSTGTAAAQPDDRAAVLELMQQAFDAVRSGDPDDWRAIQLAEGTSISIRPDPSGRAGETLMRVRSNEAEAVATADADGEHENIERWTGDPTVTIRGRLAAVWGEYEYWIDGEFSHCGIDAAQLVKVDDTWKIANWTWTVEPVGCPTDPSR
jgi:hypothetical protein